jgi:hypothetical protein
MIEVAGGIILAVLFFVFLPQIIIIASAIFTLAPYRGRHCVRGRHVRRNPYYLDSRRDGRSARDRCF